MGQAKSVTHLQDTSRRGRINAQMVQNVLLVWLDGKIDENQSDCQNTITQLRRAVNTIETFTDEQESLRFLEEMADEKICMIISGSLGQQVIPRVHNLPQVDSVFIFCSNKQYHEGWAKDWSKIKGVFTEIAPICDALKQTAQQCERNAISISIMAGGDVPVEKTGNRLDPSFMYTQIMKEILLTIYFQQHHFNEFIQYCREVFASNGNELKNVDRFARQYHQHTPIWWYTCECFLYPMLNRALRTMDANLLIKLGFFIGDLHRQIEQLHREQFASTSTNQHFTLYRGQAMDQDAFHKMLANKGGLLSFNSFLSTSKSRSTSLQFAQHALSNNQLMSVLFVMMIDPGASSTSFASVIDVAFFGAKEDEVLFSMHTIFRIGEITTIDGNARLVQVQLTLTTDKDNDLHQLIEYIRKETFPDEEGWSRLSAVLWKMGEPVQAQQICKVLLNQTTDEKTKAVIYNRLGVIKEDLREYPEAIVFYRKSIEIKEKQSSPDNLSLADSYGNIGNVYTKIGDYAKALSSYEKALAIRQESLPPTHLHLAFSYNNIGVVYKHMRDYPKALSYYEKTLAIKQQSLPPNHPDLAMSYNNIGIVHGKMGDYPKALSYYDKSLAIKQQSLPPNHPDLASTYGNMGLVYQNMGNYSKAHSYFEQALDVAQRTLPADHPELQQHRNHLADIKRKL